MINKKIVVVNRPLHMCITTLNVDVVKRWAELASPEEISEAIDIPSSTGTALCMAAAVKKDREIGKPVIRDFSNCVLYSLLAFSLYDFLLQCKIHSIRSSSTSDTYVSSHLEIKIPWKLIATKIAGYSLRFLC